MAAQIITTEDLYIFKQELLEDLKELITNHCPPPKKWMKSPEVRELLDISPGTLQNMRINGTLPYTKIGGVIYYAYEDIFKLLERNKRNVEGQRLL
jgi:hypothetical protein